ncbi:hypothetical protein LEM8419_01904 [Neolewinella maritima]|uniref:CopG family transcriptional regulator n=1 Tax=Neolewinella maritima TaxID=1383882 RepID=A0ABM9B142_9BACT|nr:hypothetical protein [Neolewinella maritima]CAH1000827.1 hypothetical protein LEM8419_01904 [Neolewinella maritima]
MAKKRFTDNLSGLFEDNYLIGDDPQAVNEEVVEVDVPVKSKKAQKKLSSKNFTQDLDVFLGDDKRRTAARAPRRRRTGLDYLIRSTVADDPDREPDEPAKPDTKRVTLVFVKDHLLTLKEQAKSRKMYLKDVVQEMVAQYLEK